MVLGNNGSVSDIDIVDSILGSFFGAPMLRTSQYWPRPCTASTSGYPNFQPRCTAVLHSVNNSPFLPSASTFLLLATLG